MPLKLERLFCYLFDFERGSDYLFSQSQWSITTGGTNSVFRCRPVIVSSIADLSRLLCSAKSDVIGAEHVQHTHIDSCESRVGLNGILRLQILYGPNRIYALDNHVFKGPMFETENLTKRFAGVVDSTLEDTYVKLERPEQ